MSGGRVAGRVGGRSKIIGLSYLDCTLMSLLDPLHRPVPIVPLRKVGSGVSEEGYPKSTTTTTVGLINKDGGVSSILVKKKNEAIQQQPQP